MGRQGISHISTKVSGSNLVKCPGITSLFKPHSHARHSIGILLLLNYAYVDSKLVCLERLKR